MKKLLAVFFAIIQSAAVWANPPAFLDSADDIREIIYSKDVVNKLGNIEPIEQVVRIKASDYEISSGKCTLEVRVNKIPPAPGEPTPLIPKREVKPGSLICP